MAVFLGGERLCVHPMLYPRKKKLKVSYMWYLIVLDYESQVNQ